MGTIADLFQDRTIYPTFITSYDPGKEVWVIYDLILKFHADCQQMLLLVVSQQPWHEFCSIPSHVLFVRQSELKYPV